MDKITIISVVSVLLLGIVAITTPTYASNPNLFVSAENPMFENYFSGPMVVEVIVNDPDITDTTNLNSEPDVTVNGKKLRMVQTSDGLWYGYFSDMEQALTADSSVGASGFGLDFGTFCDNGVDLGMGTSTVTISDTVGIALKDPNDIIDGMDTGVISNRIPDNTCTSLAADDNVLDTMNVLRNEKTINLNELGGEGNGFGQIGIDDDYWPFIQLYDFSPSGNVVIEYHKGGGTQVTILTFEDYYDSRMYLDREEYPSNSEVHFAIFDAQLNIDPTDEDSWSFGTNPDDPGTYYRLFDENGNIEADGSPGAVDISPLLGDLMFDDNGRLVIEALPGTQTEAAISLVDNRDQQIIGNSIANSATIGDSIQQGSQPVTIVETTANGGIFTNTDELGDANLVIVPNATEGQFAIMQYSDQTTTISVGGPDLALIDCNYPLLEEDFVDFTLTVKSADLPIAGGTTYHALTFNGQVPGPTLRVTEGDRIKMTLINPENELRQTGLNIEMGFVPDSIKDPIPPGSSITYCFVADKPGIFQYHGTGWNSVSTDENIFSGMYGIMIVDPQNGHRKLIVDMNGGTDRKIFSSDAIEFQLQYNELYLDPLGNFNLFDMQNNIQIQSVVNGMAFGYAHPSGFSPFDRCFNLDTNDLNLLSSLPSPWIDASPAQYSSKIIFVPTEEHTRWFVFNHGNKPLLFQIEGESLDRVSTSNAAGSQSVGMWEIQSGTEAIIDVVFDEPGLYLAINSNIEEKEAGALSVIIATDTACVPPPCNPTDAVPPVGLDTIKQENLVIHGLYTDERTQEIPLDESVVICDDHGGGTFEEITGYFVYELSFQDETVNFVINHEGANTSPFEKELIEGRIFYNGVSILEVPAEETNVNTGIFQGSFDVSETGILGVPIPELILLVYNPFGENLVLDGGFIGCANITPKYDPNGLIVNWDVPQYCPSACGRTIIYDFDLVNTNVLSVPIEVSSTSVTRIFDAYQISMGDGFYGFSLYFEPNGFVEGDEVTVMYKGQEDMTLMECFEPIDPINGNGCGDLVCSPFYQLNHGISPENVSCKEGLELMLKKSTGTPACVKPSTFAELFSRNWGFAP